MKNVIRILLTLIALLAIPTVIADYYVETDSGDIIRFRGDYDRGSYGQVQAHHYYDYYDTKGYGEYNIPSGHYYYSKDGYGQDYVRKNELYDRNGYGDTRVYERERYNKNGYGNTRVYEFETYNKNAYGSSYKNKAGIAGHSYSKNGYGSGVATSNNNYVKVGGRCYSGSGECYHDYSGNYYAGDWNYGYHYGRGYGSHYRPSYTSGYEYNVDRHFIQNSGKPNSYYKVKRQYQKYQVKDDSVDWYGWY